MVFEGRKINRIQCRHTARNEERVVWSSPQFLKCKRTAKKWQIKGVSGLNESCRMRDKVKIPSIWRFKAPLSEFGCWDDKMFTWGQNSALERKYERCGKMRVLMVVWRGQNWRRFTFDEFGRYWGVLWAEVSIAFSCKFNPKMRFEIREKFTSGMKSKGATHPVIFHYINMLAQFSYLLCFTFTVSETS